MSPARSNSKYLQRILFLRRSAMRRPPVTITLRVLESISKYANIRLPLSDTDTCSQILFDGKQQIVGARIRTYLLERTRLVYQPDIERNYHIFYQLCAGAPLKERKDLGLETDVTKFHYLRQGGPNSVTI